MVAPHFHTVEEAKKAIREIGHDADHDSGPPEGIHGGSSANLTSSTPEVITKGEEKGSDWADRRSLPKGSIKGQPKSHGM